MFVEKGGDVVVGVERALRWKKITEESVALGLVPLELTLGDLRCSRCSMCSGRVWLDRLGLSGRHGDKPVRTEFVVE